tara:strand:- start:82 stop:1056 length:975 start_codon:yes stop_codon:yes gene_type:complete
VSNLKSNYSGNKLYKEVTDENLFRKRRELLKKGAIFSLSFNTPLAFGEEISNTRKKNILHRKTDFKINPLTKFEDVTSYNNFYEFGTKKSDPSRYAPKLLKVTPWTVDIEGLVVKPKKIGIEQLFKISFMEERVYRLRCVEGWSMVIPWIGYSLKKILKIVEPLGSAKFVEFVTLADPKMMPSVGGFRPVLNWPYREALRIDEAFHPLTLMTFGLYGKRLPEQNGAPVRIVVPWKYGFKSPKSIVKIIFREKMPLTSWVNSAPSEYGFFSNVNPNVPHRRWSQKTERRIGEGGIFAKRHQTLLFNGYAEHVSHLYNGMDLSKFF